MGSTSPCRYIRKFKVQISEVDPSMLPSEVTDFGGIECMDCSFDDFIPTKYFRVNPEPESEEQENKFQSLLKDQAGYESYSVLCSDQGAIFCACKCPECGSENIVIDC